jgi:putative transposase
MSRKANCWNNAPMKSFFNTWKKALVHQQDYATHEQARNSLLDYIQIFYNRIRRHTTLDYRSQLPFVQSP